jgi:hypothetical protein
MKSRKRVCGIIAINGGSLRIAVDGPRYRGCRPCLSNGYISEHAGVHATLCTAFSEAR